MALTLAAGFKVTVKDPIDTRLVLSSEEMYKFGTEIKPAVDLPDVYFAINTDNNSIYTYNKRYAYSLLDKDGKSMTLAEMNQQIADKTAEIGDNLQDADFSSIAFKQLGRYKLYSVGTVNNNWNITGEGDGVCMARYQDQDQELQLIMPKWPDSTNTV